MMAGIDTGPARKRKGPVSGETDQPGIFEANSEYHGAWRSQDGIDRNLHGEEERQ